MWLQIGGVIFIAAVLISILGKMWRKLTSTTRMGSIFAYVLLGLVGIMGVWALIGNGLQYLLYGRTEPSGTAYILSICVIILTVFLLFSIWLYRKIKYKRNDNEEKGGIMEAYIAMATLNNFPEFSYDHNRDSREKLKRISIAIALAVGCLIAATLIVLAFHYLGLIV
jgi:heme A synthase